MEITFLGTGSAYPSPLRGASSIILRNDGVYWMFDCGEGSQIKLMQSPLRLSKISRVYITHLHADHLMGLPGFLCTLGQSLSQSDTVHVYGPEGLRRFLRVAFGLTRCQLAFKYCVHELKPLPEQYPRDWESWGVDHVGKEVPHPNEVKGTTIWPDSNAVWHVCDEEGMEVKAGVLSHRIPSFGYVIEEHPKPGSLDAKKLKAAGLPPGPLYKRIKDGETVTLDDGRQIHARDYLGPEKRGRKVAILQDTCDSNRMASICQGVDVLVHEATLPDEMEENAIEKGHSTPRMAGVFARCVGAKHLAITHLSQRFKPQSAEIKEGDLDVRLVGEQAKKAFQSDEVTVAEDFTKVCIPPVK